MAESKFLFGASVQGIQDFIFSTNKLKEIIGASALIEKLCKDFFIEQIKNLTGSYDSSNLLLSAAGNMKYLFDSELHCKKFVRSFLKNASDYAPGIRVVQATVKINGESLKSADFDLLEERLQIQ
jgi:CRISPR/Cas system-associated protein Cas10 (large subunit of type III CRISPR-Cas system)